MFFFFLVGGCCCAPQSGGSIGGALKYATPAGESGCFKKLFLFTTWKVSPTLEVTELRIYAEVWGLKEKEKEKKKSPARRWKLALRCAPSLCDNNRAPNVVIEREIKPSVFWSVWILVMYSEASCMLFTKQAGAAARKCTSCRVRSTLHVNWSRDDWIFMGVRG